MKISLLLLLLSFNLFSYENKMALKAGISAGFSFLKNRASTSQKSPTLGIGSYFGKKWNTWELGLTSQANIGYWKDQSFVIHNSRITGKGYFRSLSFGPHVRRYFNFWEKKQWKFYIGIAPLFSLTTFKFSETLKKGGNFKEGHKVTFESYGPMLSFGWEEQLPKAQRPSFLEINYRYLNSIKRTEVGGTTTEVESIVREHDHGGSSEHTFVITWGMLIF